MSENESIYKSETTASEVALELMGSFARYATKGTFPHKIDGLKLVHRRILDVLGTSEESQKMNNLVGGVMQRYHPHSDTGITDAIVRMCQTFNQVQPLVFTKGNFGDYGGGEAAAGRYLDIRSSKFTRDVYFNRVNTGTFTRIPTETNKGTEPAYFIPIIPMTLLTGCQGVGVGFRTFIPHMNLMSICDAVEKYLVLRRNNPFDKTTMYRELAEYFIPDYPTFSLLRNHKHILKAYQQGDFSAPAIMDGTIDIMPNELALRTLPYQVTLAKVYPMLGKEVTSDTPISKYFGEIADLGKGTERGHIDMTLKRGVDPFKPLALVKKLSNFTSSLTPNWHFTDHEGTLYNLNPVELIELWYLARHRSILGDLRVTTVKLLRECRALEARIVVADHVDEVIELFKKAESREATIAPLMQRFKLTHYQASLLAALQLQQITKQGRQELINKLEQTRLDLKNLQSKIQDVDTIILSDVNYIRKEYCNISARRTKYPDFIGAICVDNHGFIQFSSMEELIKFARIWENRITDLHIYPTGIIRKFYGSAGTITDEEDLVLPKEFVADTLTVLKYKPQSTIILRAGTIYRMDRLTHSSNTKLQTRVVGSAFTCVHKDGLIEQLNTTSVPLKKDLLAQGINTTISQVFSTCGDDLVAIYANTKNFNTIYFERIVPGNRIHKSYLGTTRVLAIVRANDPCGLVLQPPFSARCPQRHLYLSKINDLLNTENRVEVSLYKKTTSNGQKLVQLAKNSIIWTLANKRNT